MGKALLETTQKQDQDKGRKGPAEAEPTANGRALKAQLRASGFAEGGALLAPGSTDAAPTRPKTALPGKDKGKGEAAKDPVAAAPAKADGEKAPAQDKKAVAWCDSELDDPGTVAFLAGKSATPDKAEYWITYAWKEFERIKEKRPDVYKRYSKTMKDEDIAIVMLYSSQAAYAMNALLRGQVKSKAWVEAWGPLVAQAEAALKKAPKGVRNKQYKTHRDDPTVLMDAKAKEDKIVPFKTVHRSDGWNGAFEEYFANAFKTGATLDEPAFLSTSTVAGSYRDDMPVNRTIEDVKVARSVADIAALRDENEVLFPPGQRFQVVSMELEDKARGARFAVKSGTALYPKRDRGPQAFNRNGLAWHVKLKHVGVAKQDKGAKKAGADDDAKKTRSKDKKDESGGLLGLFGL
ncbi:MAG: hypothetical protein JNJ59_18535 [Deltaproteobacteria bacterium]|nr:hypothetical protein [Deltaproteobacteria bacterium]